MKRIKSILVCGSVLALTGLASLLVAAGGPGEQKAIVRSLHGDVQYKTEGGEFKPLKVNMELSPSTVLKTTGDQADAYLQVNGTASTVKLAGNTTITLAKMEKAGLDTSTDLKLDGGSVLGSVRKLSANSDYKVTVPNGVAGIRGTDFQVSVTQTANGFSITFTSVTGTIACQATGSNGQTQSQTLNTGQSWTVTGTTGPGGAVSISVTTPSPLTQQQLDLLKSAVAAVNNTIAIAITVSTTTSSSGTTTTVTATTTSSQTGGGNDNSQGNNNNQGGNGQSN